MPLEVKQVKMARKVEIKVKSYKIKGTSTLQQIRKRQERIREQGEQRRIIKGILVKVKWKRNGSRVKQVKMEGKVEVKVKSQKIKGTSTLKQIRKRYGGIREQGEQRRIVKGIKMKVK